MTLFTPKPSDFRLKIKILKKSCFGSAGCNVTYRIDPEYANITLPDTEVEVTYSVKGLEDEAINTFTMDPDGTAHIDSQEHGSTTTTKVALTVKVTDVSATS